MGLRTRGGSSTDSLTIGFRAEACEEAPWGAEFVVPAGVEAGACGVAHDGFLSWCAFNEALGEWCTIWVPADLQPSCGCLHDWTEFPWEAPLCDAPMGKHEEVACARKVSVLLEYLRPPPQKRTFIHFDDQKEMRRVFRASTEHAAAGHGSTPSQTATPDVDDWSEGEEDLSVAPPPRRCLSLERHEFDTNSRRI